MSEEQSEQATAPLVELSTTNWNAQYIARQLEAVIVTARQYGVFVNSVDIKVTVAISAQP